MARVRSPGYPSASLPEAVEFARKIHDKDRSHPVARDVAADHIGFSAGSGSADRALSALMHFGLAEKAAKGEIRISNLALRILHPHSQDERSAALREAAFQPDLFKELRDRYPGDVLPSLSTLTSYLTRSNFAQGAIGPASKAYLDTCSYLEREGAFERDSGTHQHDIEAVPISNREEPPLMQTQHPVIARPSAPPALQMPPTAALEPNEIALNIRGGLVHVEAILDYEGLSELEQKIAALKILMKPNKRDSVKSQLANVASGDDVLPKQDAFS